MAEAPLAEAVAALDPGGQQAGLQALSRSRTLVIPVLQRAVDALPGSLRHVAGYHFGWWDHHGNPQRANPGKALRPALVLLSAEAVGGAVGAALPAAAAVELVHNFSLLHDDVMDGDATRRHRPTAWKVFGVGSAILTGDALLALAFDVLAASGHARASEGTRMLGAAVSELLDGQSLDLAFESRHDVRLEECVRMARKKTAALLEASVGLGALFGGGTAAQVAQLRGFGADLGLAFQLADDLLGIWGDPSVTGKPVFSDLRSRKKSLPVVAALDSDAPESARLVETYRDQWPLSDPDLARLAAEIELAGGRDWCVRRSADLLEQALQSLRSAQPLRGVDELAALARLCACRDR